MANLANIEEQTRYVGQLFYARGGCILSLLVGQADNLFESNSKEARRESSIVF